MVESPDYDESLLQSITNGMDYTIDSWILDTVLTVTCSQIEIFDTCTSCEGESICKSNNVERKIIGLRIVRIKIFDGIVRTLIDEHDECLKITKKLDFFGCFRREAL